MNEMQESWTHIVAVVLASTNKCKMRKGGLLLPALALSFAAEPRCIVPAAALMMHWNCVGNMSVQISRQHLFHRKSVSTSRLYTPQ